MKITKRIISLLVSAMMLTTMLGSITAFADADPSVNIDPLYVDDFENPNYGHSINTNNATAANAWYDLNGTNFFSNKDDRHGSTWENVVWTAAGGEASGIPKPEHYYSYNIKTMQPTGENGYLYFRGDNAGASWIGEEKLLAYVEDSVAEGADSYSIKFDMRVENLASENYSRFHWAVNEGDRNAILIKGNKVYSMFHKTADTTGETEIPGITLTAGEWITVEYAWEKGTSLWKVNGQTIIKELKYDSAVASVPTREIYFCSATDNALHVDNIEVKAYKFKPSPNSVWFEDNYNSYAPNNADGTSGDTGVEQANANGVIKSSVGDKCTYNGIETWVRASAIMTEANGNQYLRAVKNGVNSGSSSEGSEFTKFAEYIDECGANSFIIEFDYMLDLAPTSRQEIRYEPTVSVDSNKYLMLFFDEENIYGKAGNNVFDENVKPLQTKAESKKWYRISYAYNNGTLRLFVDNELAAEVSGFDNVKDAAYSWLHLSCSPTAGGIGIDNVKFTCYSNGDDTIKSTFTGNATAGNDVTVTTTYESRLVVKPFTQFAVYDADTNALINIYDGVVAAPTFIGDGKITATATVPATGNVILKPLAWTRGLKPIETFDSIIVE